MFSKEKTEEIILKYTKKLNLEKSSDALTYFKDNFSKDPNNPTFLIMHMVMLFNSCKGMGNINEFNINEDYETFIKNFDINAYKRGEYCTIFKVYNSKGEIENVDFVDGFIKTYINFGVGRKVAAFPMMFVNVYAVIFYALINDVFSGKFFKFALMLIKLFLQPLILIPQLFFSRKNRLIKSIIQGRTLYLFPFKLFKEAKNDLKDSLQNGSD